MNPHGLVLYDYRGSPCARRVRITLEQTCSAGTA